MDEDTLEDFKAELGEEIKGVKEVNERFYAGGKAEFDLEVEGNAQDVARDLRKITVNKRKVKIKSRSQNRVEAVLLP